MMSNKIKNFFFEEDQEEISIKEKLINIIKSPKEIVKLLLPIILFLCLLIPVPYYIVVGQGTITLEDKITIDNEYSSVGSLNSAFVAEKKGNVLFYLLSYVIPSFEKEKIVEDTGNNKISFDNSKQNALSAAFNILNKPISEKEKHFLIDYISKDSITNLKAGDEIIAVNDQETNSFSDITRIINENSNKEEVSLTIKNNDKEEVKTAKYIEIDESKKLGISINEQTIYETNPQVKFNFSNKEEGPSGGLMLALQIYNKLTSEDITKGKKIVGTGTIAEDGTVGEIGKVGYKLKAAVKAKADIFIVPKENYSEAIDISKEKGYNIKIISSTSLEDALDKLKKL